MSLPLLAKSKPQDKKLINFEIQPKICIAKEVGDTCTMTVKLAWQAESPMNLCLTQDQTKLKCWQQQLAVTDTVEIKVSQQSQFALVEQKTNDVVAAQKIKINYQINKRYRRRLRSEWSIF